MKVVSLARPLAVAVLACAQLGAVSAWAQDDVRHAQPLLRMEPLTIVTHRGAFRFRAEIADTPRSEEIGLMYRPPLPADRGMLFEMGPPQEADFWMKHCPVSLSAAYIDPSGVIQEIHLLEANNTNSVVSMSQNIRFVLETNEGWFQRHHIKSGVAIATERGPLMETFFGKR